MTQPHVDNQLCKGIICVRKISHLVVPSPATFWVGINAAILFFRRALRRDDGRCYNRCASHCRATQELAPARILRRFIIGHFGFPSLGSLLREDLLPGLYPKNLPDEPARRLPCRATRTLVVELFGGKQGGR